MLVKCADLTCADVQMIVDVQISDVQMGKMIFEF
ncbi:MAG: hypothetical protein JWQ63_3498 [Mucilaginibacter sp.]|jgi:hypothetical protein|nr:hypothetical protein [Mucilaginibacter sp.]